MTHTACEITSYVCAEMSLRASCSDADAAIQHGLVRPDMAVAATSTTDSVSSFEDLQRLYSHRLFKTIIRITKNKDDAEDALQDTFLRAYRALPQFKGKSSIYAWLTRIAINSALLSLRKARRRAEIPLTSSQDEAEEYPMLEIADAAPSPEELCEARQQKELLRCTIQKLRPRLRALIELRLAHESSIKEIADSMNLSPAAIKSRMHRAYADLGRRALAHSPARKQVVNARKGRRTSIGA